MHSDLNAAAVCSLYPCPSRLTLDRSWEEICADPHLRDLPYKIEQDRSGRIVMSKHELEGPARRFPVQVTT